MRQDSKEGGWRGLRTLGYHGDGAHTFSVFLWMVFGWSLPFYQSQFLNWLSLPGGKWSPSPGLPTWLSHDTSCRLVASSPTEWGKGKGVGEEPLDDSSRSVPEVLSLWLVTKCPTLAMVKFRMKCACLSCGFWQTRCGGVSTETAVCRMPWGVPMWSGSWEATHLEMVPQYVSRQEVLIPKNRCPFPGETVPARDSTSAQRETKTS